MMKKKLFSLAVTLVMALSLAVPAFAVDVTITNGNTGATYEAYQIMTLVQSGDNYAYTVTNEWRDDLIEISGTETDGMTAAAINNALVTWVSQQDTADETRALADALFAEIEGKTVANTGDTDATFTVDNGYYLIVETTESPAAGEIKSLVMLDTANNASVDIESKNDSVPVDKSTSKEYTDDKASVSVGDSIPFTITSKVPANIAEYDQYTFVITDTMSTGLDYEDNIVVKVNNVEVQEVEGVVSVDDQVITVDLGAYILANKTTLGGADIVITYTATLTADAVTADEINNTATIEYRNDPYTNETGTTTPDIVEFDLYDIAIDKQNDGGSPLADAKFQLTNEDGEYAIATGTNGTYNITGWTAAAESATTFVSSATGDVDIDGLAAGTYTLTETEAPDGYNLLDDPITITIANDGKVTTSITDSVVTAITVVNQTGTELPSTGGMGTTIFYALGGTLVVAAAVLLITKKRMHNVED